MYSESRVMERLEEATKVLKWRPEYHSTDEVDKFESYLREKYWQEYQAAESEAQGSENPGYVMQVSLLKSLVQTKKLTDAEVRWMRNERVLVMCDAAYALTRYMYIKNESNIIERFSFRVPQKILFDIICDLEDRLAAIEIMILKARQLGMSTLVELLVALRIFFTHGVNSIIASADQQKSGIMANMIFLAYDYMPWWMRPVWTRRVESDKGMLVFGQINSGVSVQHGAQMSGIARGTTPTVYHLSEVASFQNPVEQIEASIFKAVHAAPNIFGVLESTAEGDTGWWPDKWEYSKKNWPRGRSRLCPLFLPWFCGINLYPTATWVRTRPVPRNWRPAKETRDHVAKAEMYVKSHDLIRKHLCTERPSLGFKSKWWVDGRMPIEQQWFWEVGHQEALESGTEGTWFQEMAGDDQEAFQSSFDSVFGREVIEVISERRERNYDVYGIVGQSVEERHEPTTDEIDYDRSRIPVVWKSAKGDVYRWELVPLKYGKGWTFSEEEEEKIDPNGKLFIFRHPQPGVDYSCGIDTSNGIGQDSTVMAMCARGSGEMPDEQVAEFRSQFVNHVEAYAFGMAMCGYYATAMKGTTPYREPYCSIEQIAAVGDTCQLQMRKMGYSRFHHMTRYDSKKIDKRKSQKLGWFSTVWSRPMLTDGFVVSVQNGWYIVNSPWTIEEMKHWEVHYTASGKEKKEHSEEASDDGIFANAMATFCPNDLTTHAKRSKRRLPMAGEKGDRPPLDIGPYGGNSFGTQSRQVLTLDDVLADTSRLERYRQ